MVAPHPSLRDQRHAAPAASARGVPAPERAARARPPARPASRWLALMRRLFTEREGRGPYVREMARFLELTVPAGKRVLMFGAGTGELLAQLRPRHGLGLDQDQASVERARVRYPQLAFELGGLGAALASPQPFDYIILNGVLGYTDDIQSAIASLRPLCSRHTRIVLTAYSYLWEVPVRLAEAIG
ncbi:MAG: class I SAM-dependent methyltransferase, partial [Planctomycetota bacterium]